MGVLVQVGAVTPPTNVGLRVSSVSRTWLTGFTGTLAYGREMSHFIALAASCFRRWTIPPSRGMSGVAIATVPVTCLEGLPLRVSQVPLLCILIIDKVWPNPLLCDTLNLC